MSVLRWFERNRRASTAPGSAAPASDSPPSCIRVVTERPPATPCCRTDSIGGAAGLRALEASGILVVVTGASGRTQTRLKRGVEQPETDDDLHSQPPKRPSQLQRRVCVTMGLLPPARVPVGRHRRPAARPGRRGRSWGHVVGAVGRGAQEEKYDRCVQAGAAERSAIRVTVRRLEQQGQSFGCMYGLSFALSTCGASLLAS